MYKAVISIAILTYSLSGVGYLQESEFVLREGEALNEFGQRIIPKGMNLAHPIVKGDFGPSTAVFIRLKRRASKVGQFGKLSHHYHLLVRVQSGVKEIL
jgi:hypothetical protein